MAWQRKEQADLQIGPSTGQFLTSSHLTVCRRKLVHHGLFSLSFFLAKRIEMYEKTASRCRAIRLLFQLNLECTRKSAIPIRAFRMSPCVSRSRDRGKRVADSFFPKEERDESESPWPSLACQGTRPQQKPGAHRWKPCPPLKAHTFSLPDPGGSSDAGLPREQDRVGKRPRSKNMSSLSYAILCTPS